MCCWIASIWKVQSSALDCCMWVVGELNVSRGVEAVQQCAGSLQQRAEELQQQVLGGAVEECLVLVG